MTPPRRLVIVGLDGADFHLTHKLLVSGVLPRLSAISGSGCFCPLESTIPPQTAPGWTSMTTGVNPGKHGIYYFYNFATAPPTIINSTDTSTPRIWDLLGSMGARSIVVNVPITYPARRITGLMVSGIPPWYVDEKSVYPSDLMARLKAERYELDAPMGSSLQRKPNDFVRRVIETEEKRVDLFLEFLEEEEWSLGMVVLTALDRLQHHLMGEGEDEDSAVERGYVEIDRLVGRIVDSAGPEVDYLVSSDHGFNPRPVAFYPNSWLRQEGLLTTRSSIRNRLFIRAHTLLDGHLLWVPQAISKRFQGAQMTVRTVDAVDFVNSRAFVPGTDGVLVAKSRVDADKIISGLSALKDRSGIGVCKCLAREQVYRGNRVDSAPEILLFPRDDINIRTDPFSKEILSEKGSFPKSNHGPTGIFLATGPGIRKSTKEGLSIEDVTPTALRLLGIDPPDYMDGHPFEELIEDAGPLPSHQLTGETRSGDRLVFTPQEEKEILDHLDRLGYR